MIFIEHLTINCGVPTGVLAAIDPQLTSKCFAAICMQQHVNAMTITEYYRRADGQIEWLNQTNVSSMRDYGTEIGKDWNISLCPMTYA